MTHILALSGKKQSGKNTSGNFLLGLKMLELGLTHGTEMTSKGELKITDIWGDEKWAGCFDYYNNAPAVKDFLDENIHPWFKLYSFADLLKRDVCIGLLGLTEEQCFGTDEQKNTETHLRWENMPGVVTSITDEPHDECPDDWVINGRLGPYYVKRGDIIYHNPGPMTAREVMQFVGTDVFRKMYHDVWAQGTVNRILKENSEFAVLTDLRFPNEVQAVQNAGGKVIRFTRCKTDPDQHASEIALDDFDGFDAVIDNHEMKIGEQNGAVYDHLVNWGFPVINLQGLQTEGL